MKQSRKVKELSYPEPLRAQENGTWTQYSVVNRLPEIARRVLEENALSGDIERRINQLIADIPNGTVRYLDDEVSQHAGWNTYIQPHSGKNWLQIPWFFAEEYFYRRILEAVRYFVDPAGKGLDPFQYQKDQGLISSTTGIRQMVHQIDSWKDVLEPDDLLKRLLYMNLWGNQADLSLWPVEDGGMAEETDTLDKMAYILVDDTDRIIRLISGSTPLKRLDMLSDNAGFELLCDLLWVDHLLACDMVEQVVIHIKAHPVFVSDVIMPDMERTFAFLNEDKDEQVANLGKRLNTWMRADRLKCTAHPFWVSPLPFWEMPEDFYQELKESNLIISKGDANYRRLLGDLHWRHEAQFSKIMSSGPAPVAALRVFKSEIVVGLPAGLSEKMSLKEKDWLYNGRWGLIQFSGMV